MEIEYIKIIDFILSELHDKEDVHGEDLDSMEYKYEKETKKEPDHAFWEKIMRICEDKNLVSIPINSSIYRITPYGLEILMQNNGSYLEYWESQNEQYLKNEELIELQRVNLELQNRQMRNRIIFSVIGFIFGFIAANWKDILSMTQGLCKQ